MLRRDLHQANRLSWNAATRAHNAHKREQARFLREGGSTLFPEELELLGEVHGRRLLHLCCNAGQDTLSLAARHGALATGVDISDEAIDFARRLSRDSGIDARFERADIYDFLPEAAARGERYDVLFMSYGALFWLSDLDALFAGATSLGVNRIALLEFHPFVWMLDAQARVKYTYFSGEPETQADGVGDYVGAAAGALSPSGHEPTAEPFVNPHPAHAFAYGIAEITSAMQRAGFRIERLTEYAHSNGCAMLEGMQPLPGRRFAAPPGFPPLPLMLGIVGAR
jgi:SAM-dependent methyltransferase